MKGVVKDTFTQCNKHTWETVFCQSPFGANNFMPFLSQKPAGKIYGDEAW